MEAALVSAAHGAMGSLLNTLRTLLTDKYKLVGKTKEQIRFLQSELQSMHTFLERTSDYPERDVSWEKQVRELSYDIEDTINEFMLSVECKSNSKQDGFQAFMERNLNLLKTINTRHKIAKKLEDLKCEVVEVNARRKRYQIVNAGSVPNNTPVDHKLELINPETAGLEGIDGPRDDLIQLMDEEPASKLKVLSIVGFGGLGKTTLANVIYRMLQGQYQCRALVSVSQKQSIEKILRAVLSQVGYVATSNTNMDTLCANELINALHKFLLDKRYLVFIDDIWGNFNWESFKCALPDGDNGSRVITTTRIEDVARACCNQPKYIYRMKQLSDEDSRKLFYKRIFESEDACPSHLKEVSNKVLKKCGGLPLAIKTISSLLANMDGRLESWKDVLRFLPANSEVNRSLEGMRQTLSLSYIYLPPHLRTCMLYIGIYPEDYEISKNDLTKQWVAEGFIGKGQSTKMLDVAKIYFNQLINMSIMQPTEMDYNGEVVSCRVHDMMLDLILHKAREENFLTVIDDINDIAVQQDKIRRLALHLDGPVDDREVASASLSQIRTLARFGTSSYLPPFSQFKHLRVLIVEIPVTSESEVVLDFAEICHLFELRYLKIVTKSHDVVLHSKIGNLLQLETFHLEFRYHGNSRDKVAEKVRGILCICVEKLCNLKYLHVNADP